MSGGLTHALLLQLERDAVVDVVADVLLVGQDLMHGAARPGPAEVGPDRPRVEDVGDLALRLALARRTAGRSSRTISTSSAGPGTRMTRSVCRLFCSPRASSPFDCAVLVDQHPPQAVAGRPALAVAELDQPALPLEDLGGQLPAVLAGHRALDALDDGRDRAAVVLELLGAVVDADAGALADVLVVGALVGVLEPAPAADVVDEDGLRSRRCRSATSSISCLQRVAAVDAAGRSCPRRRRCGRSPRRAARRTRGSSAWFSVEYCWCSVDMRTYSAARTSGDSGPSSSLGSCCGAMPRSLIPVPGRHPDARPPGDRDHRPRSSYRQNGRLGK